MKHEDTPKRYWFRAKRYGWGWGLPATWEGWVFLLIWMPVTVLTSLWLADGAAAFIFLVLMLAVLFAVCLIKGEPPRWRWGDKD